MKREIEQIAKDWLVDENYDEDQYVFRGSNSPHGVNHEGIPLSQVLADFAEWTESVKLFNTNEK
jgi:hypothetical protein